MLAPEICQQARLSRDARFDGLFFTAVKTTGIYCRSVCPVAPPAEENVQYFPSALEAANAGYRPCLRCRPDSAPGSPAWQRTDATVTRAIRLINQGALQNGGSVWRLSERLGISERYLRQLFNRKLGVSPKSYALYQQCLFAKQLLHQTRLPVTEIALASGFNSLRRFNDCFKNRLNLTPSQVRKVMQAETPDNTLQLKLHYRPPYNWSHLQNFLTARLLEGLEWIGANYYGRTLTSGDSRGWFTAHHHAAEHCFVVELVLDDLAQLIPVVENIRRMLDLDADMAAIEPRLETCFAPETLPVSGLRLPGIWSVFEAGIRAILGQQVSVTAARRLATQLVQARGEVLGEHYLFPTPEVLVRHELTELKMPASRKQTLFNLAHYYQRHEHPDDPEQWLALKEIGRWTVDYARMRGLSEPDIYLAGDLGVKKAAAHSRSDPEQAAPWRSYLTLQLWSKH